MFAPRSKLIAATLASGIALSAVAQASGSSAESQPHKQPAVAGARANLPILSAPSDRFKRSIAVERYRQAYARARSAGAAPHRDLLRNDPALGVQRLATATDKLRKAAEKAARSAAPATVPAGSYGVSQSTLDAIASCESGGNPAAVSAGGTYRGLYQFDAATWASVGGSGDPAAASPAEQSMRAAMLYSQVGSSAWPVCGQ